MKTVFSVMGCGTSPLGQIGQTSDTAIPTSLLAKDVKNILSGSWTSIFIHQNDQVSFLGCNKDEQIPHAQTPIINTILTPQNIKNITIDQIACGDKFTAIINPQQEIDIFGIFKIPENILHVKFSKIFGRFEWLAAITANDNQIYVCKSEQSATKIKLSLSNEIVRTITTFSESQIAILSEKGNLYIYNDATQNTVTTPSTTSNDDNEYIILSPIFDKIVSIASTRSRSIILKSDGRVFEVIDQKLLLVTGYDGLPIQLFAGGASLGLITYQGDCYMWGCGTHGQLGNGSFLNISYPQKVIFEERKVIEAAAGEEHTLFLTIKESQFAVLLPELMRDEPMPAAVATAATIPFGFRPPEFDMKF